ncbi:uncharacterized protein TNCV_938721 [Trichonephila clavipes]|nr:uncharacterized protein TNCV_938721 [Trichonephila clavipes]
MSFVFGPQELQQLHTVPSIYDGDLLSFLDESERAPMDLTMPRLNSCVKKLSDSSNPWICLSIGSHSIASPSHLRDARQVKPPTEGNIHYMTEKYDKARETRTTTSGTNRAAERRPVRFKQATAVTPCHYYRRSRVKQPEGIPDNRRSIGIASITQNNIRRSLSMEDLDVALFRRLLNHGRLRWKT